MITNHAPEGIDSSKSPTWGIRVSGCLPIGQPLPISLIDLAQGDLRFLTDRPLRYGTQVNLVLYQESMDDISPNSGSVHWCRPHSKGWHLGVHLDSPIPEAFIDEPWWEIRRSIRYDCCWNAWAQAEGAETPHPIVIQNYSLNGIIFESAKPIETGATLKISQSPSPRADEYMLTRVERVDPTSHNYSSCFLPSNSGRRLSQMFNGESSLHMEDPFIDSLIDRSSLRPEMIEQMPVGGFESRVTA